jgi:hypothetical protein
MRLRIHLLALFAAAAFSASGATTTTLYQYGWDLGGPLTITFTADDANNDSAYDLSELTAFQASFVLPNSAGTLTLGLPEVLSGDFYYANPSDYFIVAGDLGTVLRTDNNSVVGPLGLFAWDFNTQTAITTEALRTSPVPEPRSVALVAAPLAILLALRRSTKPRAIA